MVEQYIENYKIIFDVDANVGDAGTGTTPIGQPGVRTSNSGPSLLNLASSLATAFLTRGRGMNFGRQALQRRSRVNESLKYAERKRRAFTYDTQGKATYSNRMGDARMSAEAEIQQAKAFPGLNKNVPTAVSNPVPKKASMPEIDMSTPSKYFGKAKPYVAPEANTPSYKGILTDYGKVEATVLLKTSQVTSSTQLTAPNQLLRTREQTSK